MSLPPIVMFPAVQWADLHQRPHHFARLFAARGHRVVWVEGRDLGVQAPDPIWRALEDHSTWRRLAAVQETHGGVKIVRPVVEVANDHGVRAGSRRNWLRGLMQTNYLSGGITWIGYVAWIDAVLSFSGSGRIVYDCCD
ncbi:MAG: hypothetical protein KGK07_15595, partial [Chloroflexota bacterium]|nr:hypothetical protein [Chloroflexota bacterium]